jgi:DHA3 family macrolide efflux protein-like MFS transporter
VTTGSIAELLGIGFAGGLVAIIGWGSAFFVDGATFIVSALFVVALRHRARHRDVAPFAVRVVWDDLRAGFERIRTNNVLRGVIVTYAAVAIGMGAAITLSILQALDIFTNSGLPNALRITTIDLATTAGLLIGSIVIGVGGPGRAGRKYVSGILAFGLLMIALCFAQDIRVAAVLLFAMGVANEYFGIPMLTITQAHTEDEMRGRVMAVRMTLTRVAAVVGLTLAGVAAQLYGVVPAIAGVGVYMTVLGVAAFLMPALRRA